jgi:hypothetical protein
MTVVFGIAAIVLDGGLMLAQREHAQATADAAALAGAVDLANNYNLLTAANPTGSTSAVTTAQNVASANGFNNDGSTNTVTVNIPPTSGQFTNTATYLGYVEVIVTWNQPRYFSGIFGSGTIPVSARAVARGKAALVPVNILTLSPSGNDLSLSGSGSSMTVPGAIIVDSNSSSALSTNSSATIISQSSISVDGGISSSNTYAPSSGSTANVKQNTGTYVADPLSSLPVPNTSGMTVQSSGPITYSSNTTLQPGIYQGDITIKATVTMQPGIYYLGGNLTVKNNGVLQGSGVMIYISTGSVDISSGTVSLTPPTTGTYANISIFQARNDQNSMTLKGNSGTNIGGVIYAAQSQVTITGGSNIIPGVAFIVSTLTITGNSSFTIPQSPIQVEDPTTRDVRLVE